MPVYARTIGIPVGQRLGRLAEIVAALRSEYLTEWAGQIVISMRRNIDESRSPEGEKFDPLKRARGKGHNQENVPLRDSLALHESITFFPPEPVDIVRIGPTARSKKGFPYPKAQNKGIDGRLPARKFIGLRQSDRNMIQNGAALMRKRILEEVAR